MEKGESTLVTKMSTCYWRDGGGTGVCYAISVCTSNLTLNLRNPGTATSTATPPPPAHSHVNLDLYDPMFATPAPFMDICPALDSILCSYTPAISANHVPRANLVNNRLMPPCIPPTAPIHVDPVAIAATTACSNAATATPMCFAFPMLSCRRAASFGQFVLEEVSGGFRRGLGEDSDCEWGRLHVEGGHMW